MEKKVYRFEHETDIFNEDGVSIPVYVEALDAENFGVFVTSLKMPVDFEKLPVKDQEKIKETIAEHFFMEDASDAWGKQSMGDLMETLAQSCIEIDELNSIRNNK